MRISCGISCVRNSSPFQVQGPFTSAEYIAFICVLIYARSCQRHWFKYILCSIWPVIFFDEYVFIIQIYICFFADCRLCGCKVTIYACVKGFIVVLFDLCTVAFLSLHFSIRTLGWTWNLKILKYYSANKHLKSHWKNMFKLLPWCSWKAI